MKIEFFINVSKNPYVPKGEKPYHVLAEVADWSFVLLRYNTKKEAKNMVKELKEDAKGEGQFNGDWYNRKAKEVG